jgi:PAS domain S-box-containing protein
MNAKQLEQTQWLQLIFDYACSCMGLLDSHGRVLYANPAFLDLTNCSLSEAINQPFWALLEEKAPLNLQHQLQEAIAQALQGQAVQTEIGWTNAQGEQTTFDLKINPVGDRPDQVTYLVVEAHNISAYKNIETSLCIDEDRFNLAIQAAKIGFWDLDLLTKQSAWSNGMAAIYGFEVGLKSFQVELFFDSVHPDDLELVNQADEYALNTGDYKVEYRILRPDGSIGWIAGFGKVSYDEAGRPLRLYGVDVDITDRKQVEIQNQKNEEKFRQLAESIQEVFWLRSLSNKLLYISPGYERIWGRSVESLHQNSESWLESVVPEDRELVLANNAQEQLLQGFSIEYRIVRPDGEIRWINDQAFPIQDDQGRVYRIAGIANDITERKHIEAQLRASLQEKEILLREIHHRVKNNMQMVSSLLNLQTETLRNPQLLAPFIESQNRVKALSLIHEGLYQSDSLEHVDFANYLHKLVTALRVSYNTAFSNIVIDIDVAEVNLALDVATPCGLIVNELVTNAIKYAFPENRSGVIEIEFLIDDLGQSILTVRDNGIGFPANLDFRNTETLGLQLVSALATKLRGQVELDRSHGTAFVITFRI